MELSVFYDHVLEAAQQGGGSVAGVLRFCHECGIRAVEMHFSFLDEHKTAVCTALAEAGMKVSCIYEWFDFGRNPDTSRGRRLVDAAAEVGAPRVLVIPGELELWEAAELCACSGSYGTAERYMRCNGHIQNMRRALAELVDYAAPTGVQVTLEDYDGFLQPFARINQLLWFMRNVPGLRFTLDTGNFSFSDEDVARAAEVLGEYIVHVHCKDRRESPDVGGTFCRGLGQCPAGEGYIPIGGFVRRLKAGGYDGYLAIEHFGVPDQLLHIEKSARYLAALL